MDVVNAKRFRVACLMMHRDEGDLLRPWVMYHAALFGIENLYIFDNGSSSLSVRSELAALELEGAIVDRSNGKTEDYRRKGQIIGSQIRFLEGQYDFFIPLDCDEFVVVRTGDRSIACDPDAVHAALEELAGEKRALQVDAAFWNILNSPEWFWCWSYRKVFFAKDSFLSTDHGHHNGRTKEGGILHTNFAYMHYHHKPYELMVEHAKNKLRPFVDVENREALERFDG